MSVQLTGIVMAVATGGLGVTMLVVGILIGRRLPQPPPRKGRDR